MSWVVEMERARRFERPTPTLARLCSTPELRPLTDVPRCGIEAFHRRGSARLAATSRPRKGKIRFFAWPPFALHKCG